MGSDLNSSPTSERTKNSLKIQIPSEPSAIGKYNERMAVLRQASGGVLRAATNSEGGSAPSLLRIFPRDESAPEIGVLKSKIRPGKGRNLLDMHPGCFSFEYFDNARRMNIVSTIEARSHQGTDSISDAVAIPFDTRRHPVPPIWSLGPPRRLSRVERQFVAAPDVKPSSRIGYLFAKRCLDLVGAVAALVVFAPVMLLVALIIKLTDWGPVLYVHKRAGLRGAEFSCYKFRSMIVDADKFKGQLEEWNSHEDSRTFKIPNDPRVTWIGRLMRRSSVDELPQLFNVVLGQMSLVGPRPPVPSEVAQYTPGDMRRLGVKPGLTCLWQVSGRSRLPFPEQLRLDLQYVEERSFWLDVMVILRTVPAVLSADGAY